MELWPEALRDVYRLREFGAAHQFLDRWLAWACRSRILRISWDEAWGIMERAVARGQAAKGPHVPARIGVDEKAAAKGHTYLTLVTDLDAGTVCYIADDRTTASLDGYFEALPATERAGIQAVAMDMWQPYINSVLAHLPGAEDKIVFDRFHIMGYLGKAVDTVRKREHKALRAAGDDTLTKTKYLWLYSAENLPERHRERFNALRDADLKTARAWAIKEDLRWLWGYRRRGWAKRHWKAWYFWATHSRLGPVIDAARTIARHLRGVLNFFAHRITNAVSEGLNSKIQMIKKRAYGFRNREHFKTAIFFTLRGPTALPQDSRTSRMNQKCSCRSCSLLRIWAAEHVRECGDGVRVSTFTDSEHRTGPTKDSVGASASDRGWAEGPTSLSVGQRHLSRN